MHKQLTSGETSSPWTKLDEHVQAIGNALPDEAPKFKKGDDFPAKHRLREIGIELDKGDLKKGEEFVDVANRLIKTHNHLTDMLRAGASWDSVYKSASATNKQLLDDLDDYRERRLLGIRDAIRQESMFKVNFEFDRKRQSYSIVTGNPDDHLKFFWRLRAMALQMGGASDLKGALGYTDATDLATS
jgi:hypothetical protein